MGCPWGGNNEQAIFLPIGWFQVIHIAALSHAASRADVIDIFLVNCSETLYCSLRSNQASLLCVADVFWVTWPEKVFGYITDMH